MRMRWVWNENHHSTTVSSLSKQEEHKLPKCIVKYAVYFIPFSLSFCINIFTPLCFSNPPFLATKTTTISLAGWLVGVFFLSLCLFAALFFDKLYRQIPRLITAILSCADLNLNHNRHMRPLLFSFRREKTNTHTLSYSYPIIVVAHIPPLQCIFVV